MLQSDKKDSFDKQHLSLPEKESVFRDLLRDPASFTEEFNELSDENQIEIVEMVEKSGKGSSDMLSQLSPQKFGRLKISKEPLATKVPKYTQSNHFREAIKEAIEATENNNADIEDFLETETSEIEGKYFCIFTKKALIIQSFFQHKGFFHSINGQRNY